MTENVVNDLNRRGVYVCGQHGIYQLEMRGHSPATVEAQKEGGFVEREHYWLERSFR